MSTDGAKRAVVTEPCASRGTGSDDQVSTRFGAARPPVRSYIRRPDRRRRGEGDGGAGGGAPSSSRPAPAAVAATGGAVEEVAVDVGGDADARVAEHLRHGLEVHASGEGEGGGRMAELVRVPVTDAGTPTRRRAPAATSLRSTSSRSNASSRVAAIALRRSADRRVCVRSRGGRASGRRRGGQSPVRVAGCRGTRRRRPVWLPCGSVMELEPPWHRAATGQTVGGPTTSWGREDTHTVGRARHRRRPLRRFVPRGHAKVSSRVTQRVTTTTVSTVGGCGAPWRSCTGSRRPDGADAGGRRSRGPPWRTSWRSSTFTVLDEWPHSTGVSR